MKKVVNLCMCLSLFSFVFSGCGKVQKSMLFEVSGNGLEKPSYIFGTHHMAPLSVLESYKNYKKAFGSAEVVAGELLMTDLGAMQKELQPHMMAPEGFSYKELLSETDYALLDSTLTATLGVGLDLYGSMHPAALNMMYTVMVNNKVMEEEGIIAGMSIDEYVQKEGIKQGKEVAGLETIDDQVYALFYAETPENQLKMLMASVENPDYAVESAKLLNKYYQERDLDKLYDLAFNNPDDPEPMSEEMAYAINKERNDAWMKKLPGMMSANRCFVAVGALHLAGEEGLVNQLRQLGYKVTPLK